MTIGALVSKNFDMTFSKGANILEPGNSRGPPPCFPQRHQKDENFLFNRDNVKRVPARTVKAGINRRRMTQRIQPPTQAGMYQDMTDGTINEEWADALGSNYTRMGVCTEASCGVKGWNGEFDDGYYGDYYAEPELKRLNAVKGRRLWNPPVAGYKQRYREIDPENFVPRMPATQADLYEPSMVALALQQMGDRISLGPISVERTWFTWLLIAIVIIFMVEKLFVNRG